MSELSLGHNCDSCDFLLNQRQSKPNRIRRSAADELHAPQMEGDDDRFEKREQERARDKMQHREGRNQGFRCVNSACRSWVPLHDLMGTKNRNHCPCCLASKHVDEKTGDRSAECGSRMDAIALTTKKERQNRYAEEHESRGELMLVHECSGCGFHRINRIAADDNDYVILRVFEQSLRMPELQRLRLLEKGIALLGPGDLDLVRSQFVVDEGKPWNQNEKT